MSIYKFRILLESKEEYEIFRDVEIKSTQNFDDLHEIIVAAYGFDNLQMASFYVSNDEWEKGQEISLFDMQIEYFVFFLSLAQLVTDIESIFC